MVTMTEDHRYFDGDGREYTGVTTALKHLGIIEDRFYQKAGTERGTRVHTAISQYFSEMAVPEMEEGDFEYYLGFLNFVAEFDPQADMVEEIVDHEVYGIAGTLDLRCRINDELIILDWKTGSEEPWHKLQLQMYYALTDNGHETPALWSVYLGPKHEKNFRVVPHETRETAAKAVFTITNWKRTWMK